MTYTLGNHTFTHPVLLASGCWCQYHSQLSVLSKSQLECLITKTATWSSSSGNILTRDTFYRSTEHSINLRGLPNEGYQYYLQYIKSNRDKPCILSLDGRDSHLGEMLEEFIECIPDGICEINISCPNVCHRIMAYHMEDMEKLLTDIKDLAMKCTIGLKLPPYFEEEQIQSVATLINGYCVSFVTCCNTIPAGLTLTEDGPLIGGISGKLNKPIALANVYRFRKYLRPNISIIGCGGITNCEDVKDFLTVGANLVALGSSFLDAEGKDILTDKVDTLITCWTK